MVEAVIPSHEIISKTQPPVRIQAVLREWNDFYVPEMVADWQKLTAQGACGEPFYQPEWFQAFHITLAPNIKPFLVTVHKGSDLVGLLPLMRAKTFFGRIPATSLQSLSNVHSCRFDLLHDGTSKEEVAKAAWRCLRDNADWDVIEARDVPTNGNFGALMKQAQSEGFPTFVWPTRRMPYLPLPLDGQDPFKNCPERFKGTRTRLRAKEKKLRQEGALSFTVIKEAIPEVLGKFFELEGSGWKGQNGSAIGLNSSLVSFYTNIAKMAEKQGTLRLYCLNLDGQPIAMHFGLQMNGVYYIPKVTYDERFKKFSPGLLLAKYVIEALVKEGVACFDFLGPRMEWKCVWTSDVREHSNCYIFNRTLKGRTLKSAIQVGAYLRRLKYRYKGDPQEI
jgi:CelD/BcsL family acetyltransferase involved in cellulose biosynthesis